jgi:hypothetical protein
METRGLVCVGAFVGGDHQGRVFVGPLHSFPHWTLGGGAPVIVSAS